MLKYVFSLSRETTSQSSYLIILEQFSLVELKYIAANNLNLKVCLITFPASRLPCFAEHIFFTYNITSILISRAKLRSLPLELHIHFILLSGLKFER